MLLCAIHIYPVTVLNVCVLVCQCVGVCAHTNNCL